VTMMRLFSRSCLSEGHEAAQGRSQPFASKVSGADGMLVALLTRPSITPFYTELKKPSWRTAAASMLSNNSVNNYGK
jgi:hypothetical protein